MDESDEAAFRSRASLRRFNQRLQISRAAVFAIAYPLALLLILARVVSVGFLVCTLVLLASALCALIGYYLAATPLGERLGDALAILSLAFDGVMITILVHFDGGVSSAFFLWYIANTAAATFAMGMRATYGMMAFNSILYLGTLLITGEIGPTDDKLLEVVGRLVFLFGASYFAFRGITLSREKRLFVKRLQAEEKLKVEALTRLTEELDQQSREIADANVQIQQADRLKSQFLATMSHELRTPLNSVIGFAHILETSLADRANEKERKFLANILQSGEHLLSLINDLLDLSKIEAGRMEVIPEPFEIDRVLQGVREIMKGSSALRGIEIAFDIPGDFPIVQADLAKFKQIVFNLLSNAVAFSPDHSTVTIRVRTVPAETSPLRRDSFRVDVIDRGIGIAPADQEVIFEEFRQAEDGFVRQYGGTGLGLTLVKRFLEIQGGSIELKSTLGAGSTFSAYLPLTVSPIVAGGGPLSPVVHERREPTERTAATILVVEDDPAAYATLSAMIRAERFNSVRARLGKEAIAIIEREKPALITLDLVLPDLDGWDLLRDLKTREDTREIPVIVVTMLENRELGLALGADDYFVKPIDHDRFIRRIRQLVGPTDPDRRIPSVLLIDDEEYIHDLLGHVLEPSGYRILRAMSGNEGIEIARTRSPSVIVLDLLMPGMSGFEVAHALRSDERTSAIPIVVLTQKEIDREDRERLAGTIAGLFGKGRESRKAFLDFLHEVVERPASESAPPDSAQGPSGKVP